MSMTLPMSRFIQSYATHLAEAERADDVVYLQQRAGRPTWVLETETRVRQSADAAQFLSAGLVGVIDDDRVLRAFAEGVVDELPWVGLLPERDRLDFVSEAAQLLRACAAIGRFGAFVELLDDWRATAEIHADPALVRQLSTPVVEPLDQPVD